jgi:hypothetical protein
VQALACFWRKQFCGFVILHEPQHTIL